MTDLIKRDDALAAIDTFRRDFEQSWKVQFSADIKALPAAPAVNPPEYLCTFPSCGCVAKGRWCPAPRSPDAIRKAAMLDAGYDTPVDPVVNDPPDWIWYGEDNDGKIHTSLGRWQKHLCQVRYKLAEIQPTEHDHHIDPAAIREATLREAAALCDRYPYVEGVKTAILAMIGEKK